MKESAKADRRTIRKAVMTGRPVSDPRLKSLAQQQADYVVRWSDSQRDSLKAGLRRSGWIVACVLVASGAFLAHALIDHQEASIMLFGFCFGVLLVLLAGAITFPLYLSRLSEKARKSTGLNS